MKLLPLFLLCFLQLTAAITALAQNALPATPEVRLGGIKGPWLSIRNIQNLDSMHVTKGLRMVSAAVYFSGIDQKIYFGNMHGTSIDSLKPLLQRCRNGAVILFDNVRILTAEGDTMVLSEPPSYFVTNLTDSNLAFDPATLLKELDLMEFLNGTIHFSGTGFNKKQSVPATEMNKKGNELERVVTGSRIEFENVIYRKQNGTITKPLSAYWTFARVSPPPVEPKTKWNKPVTN